MNVNVTARCRALAALGLFAFAGCYAHPYGLTVAVAPGYSPQAKTFLVERGFVPAAAAAGDELVMERQLADSVVRVRLYHGGGSPAISGSYGGSTSGSGAYTGTSNPGVDQSAGSSGGSLPSSPSSRGPSRSLTVELTMYRLDAKGVRHLVQAPAGTLSQFDSLLDVVEHVTKTRQ